MNFQKDIMIINSRLQTFNFEDNKSLTVNRVTFAFREDEADKDIFGLNKVLVCSLDPSTFEFTKTIKPTEMVKAVLGTKPAENNTFKLVIKKINNIDC